MAVAALAPPRADVLLLWCRVESTVSIHTITTRRRELFCWTTALSTFALIVVLVTVAVRTRKAVERGSARRGAMLQEG